MPATAISDGISYLYHYQRYVDDWLRSTVVDGKIKFSSPGSFNDPWDCRPCFNTDALADPSFRERQIAWFGRAARNQNSALDEAELLARLDGLRKDPEKLKHCIEQMSAIGNDINGRYRVYCLSSNPSHVLMWSHYASCHEGVCLEFACDNEVFGNAYGVEYSEEYPFYDLSDDSIDGAILPLVAKARDWGYEREYRLIAQERSCAANEGTLMTDSDWLVLPPRSLTSIIVGCKAKLSAIESIRAMLSGGAQAPTLKRAVRAPNRYELSIVPAT